MLHTKKKGSWAKTDQQTTQTEDMPQNHKPVLYKNVNDQEFPSWLSGERTQPVSIWMWVRALASLSGLRIQHYSEQWITDVARILHCCDCGVDR